MRPELPKQEEYIKNELTFHIRKTLTMFRMFADKPQLVSFSSWLLNLQDDDKVISEKTCL